jgi:hypothetical protein
MANSNRLSTSRGMASCAAYKRHSSPVLDSSLYSDSGNAVDDDCRMPEPQLSNPRKRQPSEQLPLSVNETSQPRSKKQKLTHPSGSQLPVAFWDNLSKVWLTKRALRELDRRNTASSPRSPYQRPHRFVTRRAYAELKKCHEPTQSAADFLYHCGPRCLKDIKLFARHGGPDLSYLKGVCIVKCLRVPHLTILSLVPRACQPSQSHNELEPA